MVETGKSKKELYTMLEIAKIIGTSKSTVWRTIKSEKIKPVKRQGQKQLYSESVIKLVNSKIEEKSIPDDPVQKISIETLKKQLEIKDKQIDQLNEQLRMAQINLNQAQQLQLEQAKKIRELESPEENQDIQKKPESIKKPTSKDVSDDTKTKKKDSWWRRLFL